MERNKIKYLLIKNNITGDYLGHHWKGCVVKYVNTTSLTVNNIPITPYYIVQPLCYSLHKQEGREIFTKNHNTIYLQLCHANDITEVYNKMVMLRKKVNGGAGAYRISNIIKDFKEGIFPPISDFEYMNKIWKAIN